MDSKQFQKLLLPKLREAMLYTRSRIPMKSANKFYPDKRMIDGLMMTNPDKYRKYEKDHSLVLVGTEPPRGSGKIMENTLICDPWPEG